MVGFNLWGLLIASIAMFLLWTVALANIFPSVGGFVTIPAILITAGILATAKLFIPQLSVIFPFKIAPIFAVLILFAGLFTAGALQGIMGTFGASIGGGVITPVTPVPAAQVSTITGCTGQTPGEVLGDTTTLTLNAFNREANNPLASSVDSHLRVFKALNLASADNSNFLSETQDTTAGSYTTGIVAGDVLTITGNNSGGYYVDAKEGTCINSRALAVPLDVHDRVEATDLAITMYDRTGTTALTADGGQGATACADYTVNAAADEQVQLFLELRVNTSDEAYDLAGIAVGKVNDILRIEPTGNSAGLFTKVTTPLWLDNEPVAMNQTGSGESNVTVTYEVWKLNTPQRLHEFELIKYHFLATMSNTAPSDDVNCDTDADAIVFLAIDEDWSPDSSGHPVKGIYNIGAPQTEANDIGLTNDPNLPFGRYDGVLVYFT